MTCEELTQLANGNRQFVDLARAERAAILCHLEACPVCLGEFLAGAARELSRSGYDRITEAQRAALEQFHDDLKDSEFRQIVGFTE